MNEHAGDSISVWMATAQLPRFASLTANEQADVCIVGAGIAGLTTACLLGRAGKPVVVLDDGPIVSGETERTTAHLVTALDDRWNHSEQTWDCPCHGSRFDKFGKVLDGPAITNLSPLEEPLAPLILQTTGRK